MGSNPKRLVLAGELAMLLAAATLSARVVETLISEQLAVLPRAALPIAAPRNPEPAPRLSLPALEALFPQARAGVESAPLESRAEAAPLGHRLVGTLVANQREWSMASVFDERTGKSAVCMEGDLIDGRQVVLVERGRVVLDSGEVLKLEPDRPGAPLAAVQAPPDAHPGIRRTAADSFSIERDWLARTLADPRELAAGVRMVPAFEGGRAVGFKLLSLRQGSALSALGLQSGDVLRRVNGLAIDSPERALEVYAALRDASRLELELSRAGQQLRQRYRIGP
jgi:general secretion pathway protein C